MMTISKEEIEQAIRSLERELLVHDPEEFAVKNIRTARDIYEYKSVLKSFQGSDRLIAHIARILIKTIESGGRMRTYDCLKVLRHLSRNVDHRSLRRSTVALLFKIFQQFVFRTNEGVQWCVSVIIKDKWLSRHEIEWLIEHADDSLHAVNRLLLYPDPNFRIKSWARGALVEGKLSDRTYELVALLITKRNAGQLSKFFEPNTFVWAIYKSRLPRELKVELLSVHSTTEAINSILTIALRLKAPAILRALLEKLI
jgi:hypothetical protein